MLIEEVYIMSTLSTGKLRGLQQLADRRGILTVCAIDHRGSLQQALETTMSGDVTFQDMVDFKLDLCRAIAPWASAILLDPIYGVNQAISTGILSGHTGLLVSIEETGYITEGSGRITRLLPDWGVAQVKKIGASAVKLLIYFRPDLKEAAYSQAALVARVAEECLIEDIPLLVEAVTYPVAEEKENPADFAKRKPELVIESARTLTSLPIDIYKAEFPADMNYERDEARLGRYCRELNGVCQVPWVLLSAGAGFVMFRKQVEIASKAGASGFLAGRALWQEATRMHTKDERRKFFESITVRRFNDIAAIADSYGRPWYDRKKRSRGQYALVTED
jgi:tagatose 1,6-diphosphate aldolase